MKKLILFLFLLPFFASAQIQMSQVNGLIPKLNSKQDSLPFPNVRTGDTFLNDFGTFSAPPSSGGGSASGTPVYFLPTNSPTSGYLELDYTPYSSVVEIPYSIPVGTTLLSSHLYDLEIATTTIDAGNWVISSRSKVNNLSGSVRLHVDFILYHIDGTETVLFGGDSETFNSTDFKVYSGQLPESSFSCVSTDRIGVRIYAINSGGATKTLTISLGAGVATFFSSPLRIKHSNLRDKNGESSFQHVTTDQILTWTNTSVNNTGDETSTTIKNKLGITTLSGSNTGDNAVNSLYSGIVSFPGFGTTHALAAYGDHLHTGVYEVPLTFSTGLTRTGNTITNNITQYTDILARAAQTNTSIITALGYTPWYTGNHPTTVAGYGITDAVTGTPWTSMGYLTGITSGQVTTALGYTPYNSTNPSGYITGINSGMVTSALGYTPLPTRTFGTAANSAVGDFIQINTSSAQSGSVWIDGTISNNGGDRLLRNSSGILRWIERTGTDEETSGNGGANYELIGRANDGSYLGSYFKILRTTGAATFASTVNSTGFLLNGNNLTSSLSTNYIPKWNGSSFVNSLVSDDGTTVKVNSSNILRGGTNNIFYSGTSGNMYFSSNDGTTDYVKVNSTGLTLYSTTSSTSPTTGALVVGGGIGVGGGIYSSNNIITDANVDGDVANFNEFVKSGGTSSQFLKANGSVDATNYQPSITLTTNGTSGAATFSGNTLNVPNYTSSSSTGGTYIPTFTNQTGVTSITGNFAGLYTSVGGIKTFTFKFNCVLASGSGVLTVTLPIAATNLSLNYTTIGCPDVALGSAVNSAYSISSDRVTINLYSSSTTSHAWCVTVIYQ